MLVYILGLLVFLLGALCFFLLYDRFRLKRRQPVSSLYVEALVALLDGKQESAFTKLRQVVADDSNNIDAYLRLGQILRENNQPDRALQVHRDLTLRSGLSHQEKKAILRQLVSDYITANDLKTAEAALKELITMDSGDHWAHSTLLSLQEKAEKWEDAYHTAVQLLRLEANKSKKLLAGYKFQMGQNLLKKREYHKARVIYKEAIGLDPTFVRAYLAIGDSYYDEKRFEDAVNFLNKLISAVPERGHLVIDRLKKTYFELGRFGDIVQVCESILERDPKNLEARRTLAEFHEKKGDLAAATGILEQTIDDYPDDNMIVLDLTRIYVEKGDKKKLNELLRSLESKREKQENTAPVKPVDASAIGT